MAHVVTQNTTIHRPMHDSVPRSVNSNTSLEWAQTQSLLNNIHEDNGEAVTMMRLENKINTMDLNLAGLDSNITRFDSTISTLVESVDTLNAKVATLAADTEGHQTSLGSALMLAQDTATESANIRRDVAGVVLDVQTLRADLTTKLDELEKSLLSKIKEVFNDALKGRQAI